MVDEMVDCEADELEEIVRQIKGKRL